MVVLRECVIIISVCIISITYAETNGSITACVGSYVEFLCDISETFELHIVLINHQSNEIGKYSVDTGAKVYPRFMDHYAVRKNMSTIQIRINNVRKEDSGILSCKIIYQTKQVKHERNLIIQEKLTSNIIELKIKTGTCTVLTCSSVSSSKLRLKKADNTSITGKDILLNSCHQNLPAGEFSCCLMANCSEAECKTIILQPESCTNYLMKLFLIQTTMFLSMVTIWLIFLRRTRLHKEIRKILLHLLHEEQGDESTHDQKDGNRVSTASQTTGFSESGVGMASESIDMSGTRVYTASQTIGFFDTKVSTVDKQGDDTKGSDLTQTSQYNRVSIASCSSGTSQYSDNLGFISENAEQKPMIKTK